MIWFVLVIAIAIAIGLARGGKLSNLTEVRARGWWLLFVGFGMQFLAGFLPTEQSTVAVALVLISYLPLILVVWLNRQAAGMWIAGIGILMNFTVIAANGGMPLLQEAVALAGGSGDLALDGKHVLLDESTRIPFLADIIPLPRSVVSLGDVFIAIGIGVFIEEQMHRPVPLFRRKVQGVPGSAAER